MTFQDPNFGTYGLELCDAPDGSLTNRASILVRLNDLRGDESGELPGETFAMASLTRAEVRQMLDDLDADLLDQLRYTGTPAERQAELRVAASAVQRAMRHLRRVVCIQEAAKP
jgi:hypothetical protein